MTAEGILEYGIQQFENKRYDTALEAMVLAYMKGYQKEWILDNIYACYMAGNEMEFRRNYEKCCVYTEIPYEECSLDFIPYKEEEYYIFDKLEQKFLGSVSVQEFLQAKEMEREFDDVAAEFVWDWREYKGLLKWSMSHKVYAICQDQKRAVSFCKIPEFADYFNRIQTFTDKETFQNYFHENTGVSLPRFFFGEEQSLQEFEQIWKDEHAYRLTAKGRNTDHIVLTIGIPTYNRGNLALQKVKDLLEIAYDTEIEIVVSKNGTSLYQEEYRQIAEISDARLCYVDQNKTLTAAENFRKTMELAKGSYILMVSDEDTVLQEALDHYLALLSQNPNLSYVKARTVQQCFYIRDHFSKKGAAAFANVFLGNNYLSGCIPRRNAILKLPFEKINEYAKDNMYYRHYPHDWWFSMLAFEGDYWQDGVCFILEGEDTWESRPEGSIRVDGLVDYATYSNRLEQFKGYIAFLHFVEDKGLDAMRVGVEKAIEKTSYLLHIVYAEYGFKPEQINDIVKKFYELCIWAIDEFPFDLEQKDKLLEWTRIRMEYVLAE